MVANIKVVNKRVISEKTSSRQLVNRGILLVKGYSSSPSRFAKSARRAFSALTLTDRTTKQASRRVAVLHPHAHYGDYVADPVLASVRLNRLVEHIQRMAHAFMGAILQKEGSGRPKV